ncbi:MAG: ferritin-like domain-containing protein [Candidatus Babeliales bacterium]
MGKKAKSIIEIDLSKLISKLNTLFADEWLAYYQYWIGAQVCKGPMRPSVITELIEHATDELSHAQILADRIIQLGGTPILNFNDISKFANCKYLTPTDSFVKEILKQNIEGEQCAIEQYNNFIKEVHGKDFATYNMLVKILEDEIEHEEDLENLLEDLSLIK